MTKDGKIKVLFISPEQLQGDLIHFFPEFPKINFVCIDEAHCISEWSHNFRTIYLIIGDLLLKKLDNPTILGLTATATK